MSDTAIFILIAVNLFIITGLSLYIWRLLQQQKMKRVQAEEKLQALADEVQQRRSHIVESLQVISRAVINGEVPLTEASIRCKVLLDNLDPQLSNDVTYTVFNEVYELTKHIPRLEAWKGLKGPEKIKYLDEMEAIESQYTDAINQAAKALVKQDFDRYH
ncbi:DUF2489 domain-containing protein [Amphritea balenae]|uniref:DUF2489 domain-containing protein n=1 Tax=Amphritea balenae TaxID=452629 RepID=A0A3P1SR31_9GAMM|nr:DUF2489 domain-containing protein [Amphritea balenae]RRC99529.1 DUF2489 domain-containing protein [Amphritea balenae]GGK77770.1 hypothetical protein GCM10007941_29810 [Amphritea balenae]